MALQKPSPCPFCTSESLRLQAEGLYADDVSDVEIARQCRVQVAQVRYHFEQCTVRVAELGARIASDDAKDAESQAEVDARREVLLGGSDGACTALDGSLLISRLNRYLTLVEGLIVQENPKDPKSMRVSLSALDQARKTVETMTKLYLDMMQAQLDADVQSEFRRIVMEAINAADPATRQRIVVEIQSRAAVFGTVGGIGM